MENAEKMENMEMFSGSPLMCSLVLQLRCAPVFGELCSGSRRTVLWFLENRAPTEMFSGSPTCVHRFSENRAPAEMCSGSTTCVCSGSRRTVLRFSSLGVLWFSENHTDETHFHQTDDSIVTGRLL